MKKINSKLRIGGISVALVLIISYLAVYYTLDEASAYLPVSAPAEKSVIVVLDAGHGGMDGGCSSAEGVPEKGINLNILLGVRDLCRLYGYPVEVTRDKDISIHDKGVTGVGNQKRSDMDNRLALFNKYPNSVCISIHQNKFVDSKYSGAQMFYSETNPLNEELARIMQKKFVENLQPENTREIKKCEKELFLCYFCDNPTVMIECGFLSNPEEAAKLTSEEYQREVAFTIFAGLNEFLAGRPDAPAPEETEASQTEETPALMPEESNLLQ